ncbi:hypothetical protein [Streptomyces violascens]|uniref:Lipoprotein n=1 Tax=Streptomyces violascens TaxID=67381 RepID=A0ABQ3QUA2_9ACTN|nr:hypothetical protein [Streptomyces violascens]GHI40840.1 hypothetical protein Sviol_52480 [Streptomyces violascens]
MFKSSGRGAAVVAVVLAALSVSCDASSATGAGERTPTSASASASPSAAGEELTVSSPPSAPRTPSAEKVRDAFAGLQATLGDSCTPGNCAYFLGRVYDELHRTDRAMKADPKGPGHFPEPIALVKKLDAELGGDRSFANLKRHQTSLIATRDKINKWMQGHPEDYR